MFIVEIKFSNSPGEQDRDNTRADLIKVNGLELDFKVTKGALFKKHFVII